MSCQLTILPRLLHLLHLPAGALWGALLFFFIQWPAHTMHSMAERARSTSLGKQLVHLSLLPFVLGCKHMSPAQLPSLLTAPGGKASQPLPWDYKRPHMPAFFFFLLDYTEVPETDFSSLQLSIFLLLSSSILSSPQTSVFARTSTSAAHKCAQLRAYACFVFFVFLA